MTSILPVTSRVLFIFIFLGYGIFCASAVFYLAENIEQKPRELSADDPGATIDAKKIPLVTPNFSKYKIISEKKEKFFEFFTPLIDEFNTEITHTRSRLLSINKELTKGEQHKNFALSRQDRFFIIRTAALYGVENSGTSMRDKMDHLLRRVDELPPSIVLAQAATESGWGTSRFAVKGNNYFGEWCFKSGCGFVPRLRPENSYHEVAKFDSPEDSLRSYFFNLNTHRAYRDLRDIREKLRAEDKQLEGRMLADGLVRYSERGDSYVAELKSIITTNQLYLLDDRQIIK